MTPFEVVLRGIPECYRRGSPDRDRAANRWFAALDKLSDAENIRHWEHLIHKAAGGYP